MSNKIILEQSEIPAHWYNIVADMPDPLITGDILAMRVTTSLLHWVIALPYVLGCFILTLLLSFILPIKSFDPLLKFLIKLLFRLLLIKIETEGLEKIPTDQPFIFMANHSSFLDVPLVEGFVPGFVRGIIAFRMSGWPLYGWIMGRLGNITINRDSIHGSIRSIKKAQDYLSEKNSLMIFPEGHRTRSGELLPFKRLPFYLVKQSGLALIPVAISGMYAVNNKNSVLITPGTVTIIFGNIIHTDQIDELDVNQLRDLVRDEIMQLLN
ncbi:MAG: 1-acyl-sn-glycerol-3-phosphate acyltransferase, partial [Gammaproteobacteria bacterium]|nr:1-acyl-sn-glycerol-3-phosphate acyltransferase [Gammaproteobacteria bacterium]